MEEKIEGIILQTKAHLGSSEIVKLFTASGVLSFYSKRRKKGSAALSPFTQIEAIYRKKEGLHLLQDFTILDLHMEIRASLAHIKAAGSMIKALLVTQLVEKPSPLLYKLLSSYLKKLCQFSKPQVISQSFLVKTLMHEGLLEIDSACSFCKAKACALSRGESYCDAHKSEPAVSFTESEWRQLSILCYAKTFSELQMVDPIDEKIERLFSFLIT